MKDAALIVFQKKAEKGKVKTRLALTIGDQKALEVYQYLLAHTHQQVALLQIPVFVYFEKEADPYFLPKESYTVATQSKGDLGQKMKVALKEVFSKNYQKALVIGSDCPEITAAVVEDAIMLLTSHDVVIGPAMDGGYYLIGMKQLHIDMFEDKSWSTSGVLAETLSTAEDLGLKVGLLRELNDVDVYEDLDEELKGKLGIASI